MNAGKENSLSWSLNSVPELEEIILKHSGIKENTYVCHQNPFIRVNIFLWQQSSLNIFQTQQECGDNISEVVTGTGMRETRQSISSLDVQCNCRGVTASAAGILLNLGKEQRQERAKS